MEKSVLVENLTKHFKMKKPKGRSEEKGGYISQNIIKSLDQVSFSVDKGEMLGIIGLNGSGKTTLLRTIAGIYKPDSGSVQVNGKMAPILHIGTGFHHELDARENIIMNGLLLGMTKNEIQQKVDQILEFSELQDFSEMKLKHYSAGMRARLAFSTALEVNPDILLVDEVLAVGDMAFRQKSAEKFLSFKKNGKTILYTTHDLTSISELSDRVLLIHRGKVVKIGKPNEVIQKYKEIVSQQKK